MAVLGEIKASIVVHGAGFFGLGTILLCYALALGFHHVPLWLPMISDCAVAPPEMFFFRFGLMSAAWLIALQNVVVYLAAVPRSLPALGLSLASSLCLGTVAVVNEKEASKVHSVSAVIFFIAYWLNMVILTILSSKALFPCCRGHSTKPPSVWKQIRVTLRMALTIYTGLALVGAAIVGSSHWDKHQLYMAILEWSGTLVIMVYNWSYSADVANVRLAELLIAQEPATQESESETKKLLSNY